MSIGRSKKQKNTLYNRFFISHILLLLTPLIIGSIVYYEALKIIKDNSIESSIFMLEQSRLIIDDYLADVEKKVTRMCLSKKTHNVLYLDEQDYGSRDILLFEEARRELRSYDMSGTFEADYYIFLKNSDIVITRDYIYMGIEKFYKNFFYYDGIQYDDWKQDYIHKYHGRKFVTEQLVMTQTSNRLFEYPSISYLQSIPMGLKNNVEGVILVTIKTDAIKNLLTGADKSENGWIYIVDSDGNIITSVKKPVNISPFEPLQIKVSTEQTCGSFEQRVNDENMLVSYSHSSLNDWIYVSVLPTSVVMENVNRIGSMMIIITLGILVVGTVIADIIARMNARPFRDIISILKVFLKGEAQQKANEYEFIREGVTKLIDGNEIMETEISEQRILIWSSFLGRLLRGDFSDKDEIMELARYIGFRTSKGIFVVVIISFINFTVLEKEEFPFLEIGMMVIKNVLKGNDIDRGYTYIIDNFNIALIMNFNSSDKNNCKETIEKLIDNINRQLTSQYNIIINYAVGGLYDRLIDVQYSYNEATIAISRLKDVKDEEYIMWYDDSFITFSYYYPVEIELKLINMSRAGNQKGVEEILDLLYRENFTNKSLTKHMKTDLYFNMRGTIIQIMGDNYLEFNIESLRNLQHKQMSNEEIFAIFQEVYSQICENVNLDKKSRNISLAHEIKDYIKANYHVYELSAQNIATKFQISESYFSQFFKEQIGERFSDYLRRIRIETACDLILNSDITIKEIAGMVGYSNAYSFRRAFKTIMGITPSQYRE